MDQFKKKLKARIYLLIMVAFATALLGVYDVFFASEVLKSTDVFGFQMGITIALGLIALINVFKNSKALLDDKKLRLKYNEENDERTKLIKSKAGIPILPILSILMTISGIIAGYFNVTVFYTLVIVAICQVLISGMIKLIFMKRM